MQNVNRDRKWIILILILLIAEVFWLSVDFQWLTIPFFSKNIQISGAAEAGYIISSKKDLKRRGANSLIWEDTQAKDTLFYHDSILTLSQSSAKLYLKDQTDLELSENTLVTLEEPEDKTKSEIRLRFSRGDLRARNPSFKTSVIGEDWIINLDKGSDITLRKDQGSYEFEVISGTATLQTKNGEENLGEDKIIKLNDDHKIERVEKITDLIWNDKKPQRIYTFDEEANVALDWSGEATSLVINKAGENEKNESLKASKQNSQPKLPHGSYKIRLKNEFGLSEAKTVEVWKAPLIYLKKPLPRDRLKTNEAHEFIWTSEKSIKKYQVQFLSQDLLLRQESANQNFTTLRFKQEQNLKWQVQGEDEEGFAIPALYNNEIYLRDQPLQAPKLKAPEIKKEIESKPKASFKSKWLLLFSTAFTELLASDENYEIDFSWEPVSGADQYILEVSSTPDFRKPELIKNLSQTKYVWKKVKYKKYFWRVAAGNAKGRMGLFSEPMELQLDRIKVVDKRTLKAPEPPPITQPAQISELVPDLRETPKQIELPQIPSGWGLVLAPSLKFSKTSGEQETNINLQGLVPAGLQLSFNSGWIDGYNYRFNFWTSQQTWKPMPENEYPFQENLKVRETILTFDRGQLNEKNRQGLILHENFIPKRAGQESISIETQLLLGLRISKLFNPSPIWQNTVGVSILTSGQLHEFMFDVQSKMYISNNKQKLRWSVGVGGNASYQTHKQGGGLQSDLIFLLGLEQF